MLRGCRLWGGGASGSAHAQGIWREGHVGAEEAQQQLPLALLPLGQRVPQREVVAYPTGQCFAVSSTGQWHRGQRLSSTQLHLLRQPAGREAPREGLVGAMWLPALSGHKSQDSSPGGQVAVQLPLGTHYQVLADATCLLFHPPDVLRNVR
jgi:hypothetical protein